MRHRFPLTLFFLLAIAVVVWPTTKGYAQPAAPQGCSMSFPLPKASEIGTAKFEKLLYAFLDQGCYKNWIADRQIRNTGPFINNQAFGTHNSVRIYYSPEVWHWLKEKHREGEIPDGAMIVKEMFPAPAQQDAKLSAWTVMVKDKKGASTAGTGRTTRRTIPQALRDRLPGFGFWTLLSALSRFGEKESTFIAVKNVEGDPISFAIKVPTSKQAPAGKDEHQQIAETKEIRGGPFGTARKTPNPISSTSSKACRWCRRRSQKFPGESFDHVVANMGGPQLSYSSQCLGCHSASPKTWPFCSTIRSSRR